MKKNDSHADRGLRMAVGRKAEMAERMVLPEDFADRLAERLEGLHRRGRQHLIAVDRDYIL